jgi:ABC-2 type transport system ATP-binding protein
VSTTVPAATRSSHPSVATPALSLGELRKTYPGPPPVHAIDRIDLEVARGEMFGLLGPNGAGKSTTVGVCTTRIRPSSGRATVLGLDVVADAPRVKRRIGVVTQTNTLDRSLTLEENLYYHCRYFGWSRRPARRRAHELLERFRLADRSAAFPEQISGGMAQRLQVARAIAHRPELLFLDEPTAGLDPQSRIALWELVEELREDGITVVLTTHYMEEADALCDRVAIVDHGRILVCDTPEQLKADHGLGAIVDITLDTAAEPGVLDALRAMDAVTDLESNGTALRVIAASSDGLVARLAEVLSTTGLRDLSVQSATLESVFINLTGRDLRE